MQMEGIGTGVQADSGGSGDETGDMLCNSCNG